MFPAAEHHAFDRGQIAVITSPAGDDMPGAGHHIVGGVKMHPARSGHKHRVPGVGGIGPAQFFFTRRRNGFQITAHIAGTESAAPQFGHRRVGKILTDPCFVFVHLFQRREGGGRGRIVFKHIIHPLHKT